MADADDDNRRQPVKKFHWDKEDYFPYLIRDYKQSIIALEYLVDDLHGDKELTIARFLAHCGSEDFLWGIVRLMGAENLRVSGNSAYVFGTIAETADGIDRIVGLLTNRSHPDSANILIHLVNLLKSNDYECLMNAAGTIGTISESTSGREWLILQPLLDEIIELSTDLLHNQNIWVSSNAALVLARISIEDVGCEKLLNHSLARKILNELINSLGNDNAGRGMNCAFAIGRLCDNELGRMTILKIANIKKLIESLSSMIEKNLDNGCTKNSCFALSCLSANRQAYEIIVEHACFIGLLNALCNLLVQVKDVETQWFAAMLLRIFSSKPSGCLKMKTLGIIWKTLNELLNQKDLYNDVREEIESTIDILKPVDKPQTLRATVKSSTEISCEWDEITLKNQLTVNYALYKDNECIYTGPNNSFVATGLSPFTQYCFTMQIVTVETREKSPLTDPVLATTDEWVPTEPLNLKVAGSTSTLLKITWDPPEKLNGLMKGYFVYNGATLVEQTYDLMSIVTGLQPSSSYEISVCASTSKGKGARASVRASTTDLGDVLPERPYFGLIGKREILIRWQAPQVITGKLNRYELLMNGKTIYSGISCEYQVTMLKPDTEYKFEIIAITSEGKCRSKPARTRTLRDEYDPERPPLYPGATNLNLLAKERTEASLERRKSSLTRENTRQLYLIRQKSKLKLNNQQHANNEEMNGSSGEQPAKTSVSSLSSKFLPPVQANLNQTEDEGELMKQQTAADSSSSASGYQQQQQQMMRGKSFVESKSRMSVGDTKTATINNNNNSNTSSSSRLNRSNTFIAYNATNRKSLQPQYYNQQFASSFQLNVKAFQPNFPQLPVLANNQPVNGSSANGNQLMSRLQLNRSSTLKTRLNAHHNHSNVNSNGFESTTMPLNYIFKKYNLTNVNNRI